MSVKFKCEYCGRRITEEVCPYCGAVNSLPRIQNTDSETGSVDTEQFLEEDTSRKKRLSAAKVILITVAALFAGLIIYGLIAASITDVSTVSHRSNSNPRIDKNGYYLTANGSTSSDHVLDGVAEEHISITAVGKEAELILPCSFEKLKETYRIMPVTQYLDNDGKYSYSEKEVTTVEPFEQIWVYDSYNVLDFALYNNSEETRALDQCICDSFSTVDISKVTSVLYHDKELITDAAGILDTFGEPSFQFLSDNFYSIEYQTTCGRLSVFYDRDKDGYIGEKPFSVTIENCREIRVF